MSNNHTDKLFDLIRNGKFNDKNCFEWTGAKDKDGYGYATYYREGKKESWRAHRLIYFLLKGHIPEGICVCHACDNPMCFNVNHLFLGTLTDNNQDRARKERSHDRRGQRCPTAKLYDKDVLLMRKMYDEGTPVGEIAKIFNIHQSHATKVCRRQRWKHI